MHREDRELTQGHILIGGERREEDEDEIRKYGGGHMVSLTSINLSITYAEHAQHCARSHGIYKLFLLQGADSLL